MTTLTCPKCKGHLIANPLGRWFAKFKCGHCGAALQFDQRTNALGMTASVLFVVTVAFLTVHGYATVGWRILLIAAFAWFVLMFLSYQLRRVIQDEKK